MSQENVEIVTGLVEAWNAADIEAILAVFHAECEVVFPPEVPEPGPFRGHAELRGWVEGFLAAWASHRAEVVELTLEDGAVLAMLHLTGRGSESGVEMDETDAHVFAFRDGKIISWRNFADRSQALEAVRLSE
jgi:ketosteroid isomerase-like protein